MILSLLSTLKHADSNTGNGLMLIVGNFVSKRNNPAAARPVYQKVDELSEAWQSLVIKL